MDERFGLFTPGNSVVCELSMTVFHSPVLWLPWCLW